MVTGEGSAAVAPHPDAKRHARSEDGARGARCQQCRHDRGVEAIKQFGIADRDLQTAGIQINPRYNYNNSDGSQEAELVAYQVTNALARAHPLT